MVHNFVPYLNRHNDPLEDKLVKCMLESALHSLASKPNSKKKLSADFIKSIVTTVDTTCLQDLRNCSIISLSYSLLLRHDEVSHLLCSHISNVKGGLSFFISSSKTDVHKNGKSLILAKEDSPVSVYNLLSTYLSLANLRLGADHFLFGPISFDNVTKVSFIENSNLAYNT